MPHAIRRSMVRHNPKSSLFCWDSAPNLIHISFNGISCKVKPSPLFFGSLHHIYVTINSFCETRHVRSWQLHIWNAWWNRKKEHPAIRQALKLYIQPRLRSLSFQGDAAAYTFCSEFLTIFALHCQTSAYPPSEFPEQMQLFLGIMWYVFLVYSCLSPIVQKSKF